MPANTVKVDRTSKWGNPYVIGVDGDHDECIRRFERLAAGGHPRAKAGAAAVRETRRLLTDEIEQLRGWNLACWCGLDETCHADVLLKLANARRRG